METQDQLSFLRQIGCDVIQGFVVSRPLPADEFARLVVDRNRMERQAAERSWRPSDVDYRLQGGLRIGFLDLASPLSPIQSDTNSPFGDNTGRSNG